MAILDKLSPIIVVISGPSGVGKDATIAKIRETGAKIHYVVTATTRPKRRTEKDGIDYHFFSTREFNAKIANDEFLEYARVYGNYYGIMRSEVGKALKKGQDVILKVDVQGAATLKKKIPDAVFIFLLPESLEALSLRLKGRNADSESDIDARLGIAEAEMKDLTMFDYAVINYKDNLDLTAELVTAIVLAEKCRVRRRKVVL